LEIFKNNLILIKGSKETSHHKIRNPKNQATRTCNMAKEKYLLLAIIRFLQTIKLSEVAQTLTHSK
jgi:hypothetical protein